jgi:hypothetical protein
MKHSKKENRPRSQKGFSKGKNNDLKRLGPIMIEDIMKESVPFSKNDVTVREMMIRTDPTDNSSPVIKRRFKPLDNPLNVLEVLQGILIIKEGVTGNNVTTGPLQYSYWRGCLEGTALRKFNEFASAVGTETSAHLLTVENRLVSFFAPREVLSQQARYIRYHMRKPNDTTTRQYVGAVHTLNQTLEKLPPAFNAAQKIPALDLMDILASKAPKSHKELMTDHGFDPQTATTADFVEICERAETKENLRHSKHSRFESDDDSSRDERHNKTKKHKKEKSSTTNKAPFFCKLHGPNTTHDSKTCKVLNGQDEKPDWKKKNSGDTNKYKDYASKYKKKAKELHFLQIEAKKEKSKWAKMIKKQQKSTNATAQNVDSASDGEVSAQSKKSTTRNFAPREQIEINSSDDSSSSSSSGSASSNTDSE